MIVKNETPVIERCLRSVAPLVDYVLISDTGSTDGTQELIRAYLKSSKIPGQVIERPWRNFAQNRNDAVRALREIEWIDYALVIDADEVLIYEDGFSASEFKANLSHGLYDVTTHSGNTRYLRPEIFASRLGFEYQSVLHEYLEVPQGTTRAIATGFYNLVSHDGARSQDPQKFDKDVAALLKALEEESDPFLRSRYRFYLAQSYRDAGHLENAITEYLARAKLGFWVEEIFVSLYQAGLLMERVGRPVDQTLEILLSAHNTLPTRAEALHAAARVSRLAKRYESAYLLSKLGLQIPPSGTALFLNSVTYEFGLLDELQISAYWIGRYEESLAIGERLLREAKFPIEQGDRIRKNVEFAKRKLNK